MIELVQRGAHVVRKRPRGERMTQRLSKHVSRPRHSDNIGAVSIVLLVSLKRHGN